MPLPDEPRAAATGRLSINIGLDFGTSSTKACVRPVVGAIDDVRTYPIRFPVGDGSSSYVCPSTVSVAAGNLYFGAQAERGKPDRLLRHLKVCVACQAEGWSRHASDCPTGQAGDDENEPCRRAFKCGDFEVSARELVTLYVAWALWEAARQLPADLVAAGETPRLTCNLSVPIDQIDVASPLCGVYSRIATDAWSLRHHVVQGIPVATALGWLKSLDAGPRPTPSEIVIQPETLAAIMSYVNSRDAREGMYALVDVGAWTTDISFVRVSDVAMVTEGLRTTAVYSAKTHRVAAGRIDELTREMLEHLWRAAQTPAPDRQAVTERIRLRRESETPADHLLVGSVQYPFDQAALEFARTVVAENVGMAFLATRAKAKTKETELGIPQWDALTTLLLGGGSEEPVFRSRLSKLSSPAQVRFLPTSGRLMVPSQTPPAVVRRLQVAAGLAVPSALWPKVFSPSKVERPRREPATPGPRPREWDRNMYGK